MTAKQKKRTLSILGIAYAISFGLPVIHSIHDILLGFHCAVWGVIMFIVHLSSGNIQAIIIDILLILPNLLLIFTFLSFGKFRPWLKYLFFLITILSAGSWIFTYRIYLSIDDGTQLSIGYWVWFLSITSYMLLTAIPAKKQPAALD